MKNLKFLLIIMMLAVTHHIYAEPTEPKLRKTITLPDGKTITLRMVGDEYGCYWKDTESNLNYKQEAGVWKCLKPEDVIQINSKARKLRSENNIYSRNKLTAERKAIALKGEKNVLVILVEFPNRKFSRENDNILFQRILNEPGFCEGRFTGSVRDYFLAQSNGLLDLHFDVVGPVMVSNNSEYYGDGENYYQHCQEMVTEACQIVDGEVDYSQYDWDNDGYIEQVFIIFAGSSEATSGNVVDIRAHKGIIPVISMDGKLIKDYGCSPEKRSDTELAGIGTFCHEFSHCLGLPDMYDQTTGNYGTERWDIMGIGCYNDDGFTPAGYTAYNKYALGWQEPIILRTDVEVTSMKPMSEGGDFYMIPNDNCENEYYLLENRQLTGWDAKLPGHGMLIMHVDYDKELFSKNIVNRTGIEGNDHERCGLVLADNDMTLSSNYDEWLEDYQGDLYPYKSNNSLTNSSIPASILFNKNIDDTYFLSKPVTSIMENGDGTISFRFNNNLARYDKYVFTCSGDTLRFLSPTSVQLKVTIKNNSYGNYNRPMGAYAFKFVDGKAIELAHDIVTKELPAGSETDYIFKFEGLIGDEQFSIALEYYKDDTTQTWTKLCQHDFKMTDINKFNVSVKSHDLKVISRNSIRLELVVHNESYNDFTTGIGVYCYRSGEVSPVEGVTLTDPIPAYGSKLLVFDLEGFDENAIYHANVYAAKMNETVDGYWSFLDGGYYFIINDNTIVTSMDVPVKDDFMSFNGDTVKIYSMNGQLIDVIHDFSISKIHKQGLVIIKSMSTGITSKILMK